LPCSYTAKGFLFGPMKTEISQAIIMRVNECGESDLLVTFFTPNRGLLKGIAKAGRKSRQRFVNCFGSFSLVSLEYVIKRERDLAFLHSGKLIDGYQGLRADFSLMSKASFLIELTQILFPSGVSDPRMFELLEHCLARFDAGELSDVILLLFEARAMSLGGYEINLGKCALCGRSYQGEGVAVFQPEKGGIACMKCDQTSALHPLMEPQGVKLLRRLQEGFLSAEGVQGPPEVVLQQVRNVLKLHREYRLEQKLRTSKYL
jgi:DNA repair protein RecO (recombination protein O)